MFWYKPAIIKNEPFGAVALRDSLPRGGEGRGFANCIGGVRRIGRISAFFVAICAVISLSSCRPQVSGGSFFDLKGFISKDDSLLSKLNPQVVKTAVHNGVTETKTVKIDDWKRELGMFSDADINKPAWKSSYQVTAEDSLLLYVAKEKDLFVRELIINRVHQKVRWILIYTQTPENHVYQTTQKLVYYPDSLYSIEMVQHVRLSGTNVYKIKGKILK